jgi:hypothetical protein
VRLASGFKQPFALVLVGTVPLPPGAREALVSLPRFPKSLERDATVTPGGCPWFFPTTTWTTSPISST